MCDEGTMCTCLFMTLQCLTMTINDCRMGKLGFNPSCLGTVIGPLAQPILGEQGLPLPLTFTIDSNFASFSS